MENFTFNDTTSFKASRVSGEVRVWYWVLRGLIGLLILAGNGPVIYLIVTCHRLHTISNWFVLSLSLADLFVGVFLIPVSTSCALWTNCNISVMRLNFDLLLFVSIANMCAITADRYLSVVRPLTYLQNMTNSRVRLWIIAAWLIPIVFTLIPFTWMFSSSQNKKENANRIYGTVQIITFNVLPCLTILLVYGHIFHISHKHARQIRAFTVKLNSVDSDMLTRRQIKQEKSATRVFGMVVIFFLFCWMLSAYRHFCDYLKLPCHISSGTVLASRLLMLLNSAINPFIYAFLKEDIKKEVKRRLFRRNSRVNDASFYGRRPVIADSYT